MSDSAGDIAMAIVGFVLMVLSYTQHQRINTLEDALDQIAAYEDITSSGRTQRPVSGGP